MAHRETRWPDYYIRRRAGFRQAPEGWALRTTYAVASAVLCAYITPVPPEKLRGAGRGFHAAGAGEAGA